MRISTASVNNMVQNVTGDAYNKYLSILTKIAENKNFTKMSENVPEAKKLIKVEDQLAKTEIYQSNINTATNEMSYAYDILGKINEEVTRINDLTISAANAPTNNESAQAISSEIKERMAKIVTLLNSKYMDNYIFAGTYTETMPYSIDPDTNQITYNGSSIESGDRLLTIAEDTTFAYNLTGLSILGEMKYYEDGIDPTTGDPTKIEHTTNFFDEMKDLCDKLDADVLDYDGIRNKLNFIQEGQKGVTNKTAYLSSKVSKLDATKAVNDKVTESLTEKKGEIQDVDIAKLATELSNAQYAMQASYTIGATILNSASLLNYI